MKRVKSSFCTRILLFSLCFSVLFLAGCARYLVASKALTRHDKVDYDVADEDRRKWMKQPLEVKMDPYYDRIHLRKRLGETSRIVNLYNNVFRNRIKGAAYSKWSYAANVRIAEMMSANADLALAMLRRYRSSPKRAKLEDLKEAAQKLYRQSYEQYLFVLFMGYHYRQHLPGAPIHTMAGNRWLQKAEKERKIVAKKMGLSKLGHGKMLIQLVLGRKSRFKEEHRKELQAELIQFAKECPPA